MGVVFRAEDLRLGRGVALKFPTASGLTDPSERERFVREAQAAAALNHPNICTVYGIEQVDGKTFIAMEVVEGISVKEKLRERPFPLLKAVDVALQAAEGLKAAHSKGIVHRDIKSANLMLSADRRVKVMDFGLAGVSGRSQLTKEGTTLGTAAYMSPEQALAQPTDGRTDIWSLGVVLYEMITGRLPFHGEVEAAVAYAVVNTAPEMPTALRSGLPIDLDYLVEKALRKDTRERYQHVDDLIVDLRGLKRQVDSGDRQPAQPSRRSAWRKVRSLLTSFQRQEPQSLPAESITPIETVVAVLPLDNVSGDGEEAFFSDGMTDALIASIGKLKGLRVISRHSVMRYKGTDKTLPQIAQELHVSHVVTGSIVQAENKVRITAELVEARTRRMLWADSIVHERRDILALQDRTAQAVAEQIKGQIGPDEQPVSVAVRPVNPDAYEAYLKGRYYWDKLTPPDLQTALKYFELAREKDPASSVAHTGIASVWLGLNQMRVVEPKEAISKGAEAINEAMRLDSSHAETQYVFGCIETWMEWNWEAAEAGFRQALQLNPSHAHARAYYAHYLLIAGRRDDSIEQSLEAIKLDPMNPLFRILYGGILAFCQRFDEGHEQLKEAEKLGANNFVMHDVLEVIYHRKRMYEQGYEQQKLWYSTIGDEAALTALEGGYEDGGYQAALARVADTLAARASSASVGFEIIARLYTMAGEKQKAIDWLARAYEARAPMMPYIGVAAHFDSLRDEPRFKGILSKMRLPGAGTY